MAEYIVIKRSRGDGWLPGDMLVDPVNAELVEQRGYIRRVPDGYEPTEQESRPRRDSDAQLAADAAASADEAETTDEGDSEGAGDGSKQTEPEARPGAPALAAAMEVSVEEVLALTPVDYEAGLQAYDLHDE